MGHKRARARKRTYACHGYIADVLAFSRIRSSAQCTTIASV